MCAIKNQFDHIEEKFAKSRQIFFSKRSDANPELDPDDGSYTIIPDPVHLFRIRPGQNVPASDP